MAVRICLLVVDIILINVGFLLSFLLRYGPAFPERNFLPYKNSFLFLTLIYISALVYFKVYKSRFKSSWDLFRRIFSGLFLGTLLSIAFVYVFRVKWGAFPTSVFILSFATNLFLIFKLNQRFLKAKKRIKKKVVLIGKGDIDDIIIGKTDIESRRIDNIRELIEQPDMDEIIICEKTRNEKDFEFLIYLVQKLKVDVIFSPSVYLSLLPERINSDNSIHFLRTFTGRKSDVEEFLIRALDVVGSVLLLLVSVPLMVLIFFFSKISSQGSVVYEQQRVGKDGKVFTLYKFRTMVEHAEEISGLLPATEDDPRVTKIGRILRKTRLDELPQLYNVLKGEMSLVGPRPENTYRVNTHEALAGVRLAVKPGLTGLAQIRSFYDLKPDHKIKYDYLYIQRRSLLLNLYVLLKTVPVVLSKKGQ